MSLLAREIARFILDAVVWLGCVGVIAAVTAAAVGAVAGRDVLHWKRIGWGLVGGSLAAALAVRIGAPLAWSPLIGTRPLPVAWTALGALIGAAVLLRREPQPRSESTPSATTIG